MNQTIINTSELTSTICDVLKKLNSKNALLVCKHEFDFIGEIMNGVDCTFVTFRDFSNNPKYDEVCRGVDSFKTNDCDCVLAIGGGSTIDVAKCIKLYCKMDNSISYLKQEYEDTRIPLIAVPSTAGTGSESTRYSVIYDKGVKQSVHHDSIVPNYAILNSEILKDLPLFQKKCTLLDALCQAIESRWSIYSNADSVPLAEEAIKIILAYYQPYLKNDDAACEQMMQASNLAGRAINITQTTAAHAMSYKISSLYGIPHGYAVAVNLAEIWDYMIHCDAPVLNGERTKQELNKKFDAIAKTFGCTDSNAAVAYFRNMLKELEMENPVSLNRSKDIDELVNSVNPDRLKNNPIYFDECELRALYERIVK